MELNERFLKINFIVLLSSKTSLGAGLGVGEWVKGQIFMKQIPDQTLNAWRVGDTIIHFPCGRGTLFRGPVSYRIFEQQIWFYLWDHVTLYID